MGELSKYLAVYLAGAMGIYKGIPLGIAMGLSAFSTALFTALGSISFILILYFAGDKFRLWLTNKYGNKTLTGKKEKFTKWMDRYGVAGLGLMVTGLLGPIISLLIGMMILKETKRFLMYLLLGIVLWSFFISFLASPIVELIKGLF
ncbi:hypothetical protein [Carboxylicivirga sp. N1Y90]|uniref:hypothetical protein n=1 Tax=Carboxylicivirga fragile TaxID=3417571 RepID=UPI003D33D802|nr:small multi-drug export protein [Marinilabiliaceae bacterium N1Y90]